MPTQDNLQTYDLDTKAMDWLNLFVATKVYGKMVNFKESN